MFSHHNRLNDRQRYELAQKSNREFWARKQAEALLDDQYGKKIVRPC